jgi:hypothetical protein
MNSRYKKTIAVTIVIALFIVGSALGILRLENSNQQKDSTKLSLM